MPCSAKFRNQNFQISSNLSFIIIWLCPPLCTYSPFILGKMTWPQKSWRFHQIPPPPFPWYHDFVVSLGMHGPIMTYFTSSKYYQVKYYRLFWKTPDIRKSSARIESQPDWWVNKHPLRTPKLYSATKTDSFWDLDEWKKVPWPAACPMY